VKEYPDYKYQPRKRPAAVIGPTSGDASAGTRSSSCRRSAAKRARRGKSGGAAAKKSSSAKLVPRQSAARCETPLSIAGSELSEVAESYLSSDWSVADDLDDDDDDDDDIDVTSDMPTYLRALCVATGNPAEQVSSSSSSSFSSQSTVSPANRSHVSLKDSVPLFPTGCGRSNGGSEVFDWMEDYMTPEVVDLLADDWFAAADNICLRDVAVM